MDNQDNTTNLLNKIWDPDFEIALHYPDNSITKNQRLLSNLARLGYYLILNKNHKPFIRIKHAESGKNLVNDFFSVVWDKPIDGGLEVHYFLDFICNTGDEKSMYSCLYSNGPAPVLFFDVLSFKHPISLMGINDFNNTKTFMLDKYKQYFDINSQGVTLIQNIQLITKIWSINVI